MFVRSRVQNLPSTVISKWGLEAADEGFVPFPKRLLRCMPQLFTGPNPIRDLQVVLAIADFLRPNLTRYPSADFLAFTAGLSADDVRNSIKELTASRLIDSFEAPDDQVHISLNPLWQRIVALTEDESRL